MAKNIYGTNLAKSYWKWSPCCVSPRFKIWPKKISLINVTSCFSFILIQYTAANCWTRQTLEYQLKKLKFLFKNLLDNTDTMRQLCFNSIKTERTVQGDFGNTLIKTRLASFQPSHIWNSKDAQCRSSILEQCSLSGVSAQMGEKKSNSFYDNWIKNYLNTGINMNNNQENRKLSEKEKNTIQLILYVILY